MQVVQTMQSHLLQNQYDNESFARKYDANGFPSSIRLIYKGQTG